MARFGIDTSRAFGVRVPALRRLARRIGRDPVLADRLWSAGFRETRILAGLVADATRVTPRQMDDWALDFSDWELCDQTCMNLFAHAEPAWAKALAWGTRPEEFVKRAGFVLMARLAVGRPRPDDQRLLLFLATIEEHASDPRPYVHKAVSWALRQIGKRSAALWGPALATARRLAASGDRQARWVGRDALRELDGEPIRKRLQIV